MKHIIVFSLLILWSLHKVSAETPRTDEDQRLLDETISLCQSCHSFQPDKINRYAGPNLFTVFDREIAAQPDYAYSGDMRSVSGEWSTEILKAIMPRLNP